LATVIRRAIFAVLAVFLVAIWVTSSVTAATTDPRREGTVIKVEARPDGSSDIYRAQSDGEVIVEHRDPDGATWFESNEVLGLDGQPIICANGEPLRIDLDVEDVAHPSPSEIEAAQIGLPADKMAVFDEYKGAFQVVDYQVYERGDEIVTGVEPLVYQCSPTNSPQLVPLSVVDPVMAEAARQAFQQQVQNGDDLTGLGSDPASIGQELLWQIGDSNFSGSCTVNGSVAFNPWIHSVSTKTNYDIDASGRCSGSLDGVIIINAAVTIDASGTGKIGCLDTEPLLNGEGALVFTASGKRIELSSNFAGGATGQPMGWSVVGEENGDALGDAVIRPNPNADPTCVLAGTGLAQFEGSFRTTAATGLEG
jgi:hypothetical protein